MCCYWSRAGGSVCSSAPCLHCRHHRVGVVMQKEQENTKTKVSRESQEFLKRSTSSITCRNTGRCADNNIQNPTYCPTTPIVPAVQYSSLGPRDTPTSGEMGEGVEYQAVRQGGGRPYEVPIQSSKNKGRDNTVPDYNKLQHC